MNGSSKIIKRIITVAVALVVLCAAFLAGFYTSKCTRDVRSSSYEWVLKTIGDNYYGEFDPGFAANASLKEIASLLDPYSQYYTAEEYANLQNENAGNKSGLGITFNFVPGMGARIVGVVGNSPAYSAGIRSGDIITGAKYGGEEISFSLSEDLNSFLNSLGTGQEFTFVSSDGGEYVLSKREYTASYACMYTADTVWDFSSVQGGAPQLRMAASSYMDFLPSDTAYIKLSQFYGGAADEFGQLVRNFNSRSCKSLILDLRNNGGGYVSVMQDIAGYFVTDSSSAAMTAIYKNGSQQIYGINRRAAGFPAGTRVYVLANNGTASASEALIGVLVSYGIVGYKDIFISDFSKGYTDWAGSGVKTARTYGKGIMQSTFVNYFTGEALKLTTAKIYWPNGKCIHDVGLTASDGCTVIGDVEWTATKNDDELRKVLEIIGK